MSGFSLAPTLPCRAVPAPGQTQAPSTAEQPEAVAVEVLGQALAYGSQPQAGAPAPAGLLRACVGDACLLEEHCGCVSREGRGAMLTSNHARLHSVSLEPGSVACMLHCPRDMHVASTCEEDTWSAGAPKGDVPHAVHTHRGPGGAAGVFSVFGLQQLGGMAPQVGAVVGHVSSSEHSRVDHRQSLRPWPCQHLRPSPCTLSSAPRAALYCFVLQVPHHHSWLLGLRYTCRLWPHGSAAWHQGEWRWWCCGPAAPSRRGPGWRSTR